MRMVSGYMQMAMDMDVVFLTSMNVAMINLVQD